MENANKQQHEASKTVSIEKTVPMIWKLQNPGWIDVPEMKVDH